MMGGVNIYHNGEFCASWSCYRCGEVIDSVILMNRAARGLMAHTRGEESHEEIMAAIRNLPSLEALRGVGLS
jgi:hypothetical protein